MTRIKICGITNKDDALRAADLKVDALGFVFAESPRRVRPEVVCEIVKLLPPFISTVGVFVNEDQEKVKEIAELCSLTALQFHGEESPTYCRAFRQKIIKSFRVKDESVPEKAVSYKVDAYLLDTYLPGRPGGTGKTFNWEIAGKVKSIGVPLILSGGLNPDNVVRAISEVRPYAVDVSSGVESREGKKDYGKLAKLVKMVRKAG
ncbi:MAG: phosphoribosylanthranilate isomerase [bacterium]